MTKLNKKLKKETEQEELMRLYGDRTMKFTSSNGELITLESDDLDVISFTKGKGLSE